MSITIVGLGPGDGRYLTRAALEALNSAEVIHLRTTRHPSVQEIPLNIEKVSYDHLYADAANFESVYQLITADILDKAETGSKARI